VNKIQLEKAKLLFDFRQKKKRQKKIVTWKELGQLLYPGSNSETQRVMISNLKSGKTNRLMPVQILKICDLFGVDANFLFGLPSRHDKTFNKIEKNDLSKDFRNK